MGCINSTKKLAETKNDNVLRVRVVRLHPDSPSMRAGFLELTPRELIYITQGREHIVWALQHLRRYGLNGDVFSFEAGRRCMTGPGVYTFRCQNAELLYTMFQRYVNATVTLVTEDGLVFGEREREHPSHTLGRAEANPNVNNYLEPVAVAYSVRTNMHESFSSSPISLELDSPDSVPSFSFTNEVVHFQNHLATIPGAYVNTNVYMEQPLRANTEHNNNASNGAYNNSSAFSTLSRKTLAKRSSLDMPPDECAPILTPGTSTSLHMYENVEGLGISYTRDRPYDSAERCYENLSRLDLPLLLQPPPPTSTLQRDKNAREQATPSAVNYIVLDLDQPRSPAQCSPKTYFGSGSLSVGGESVAAASSTDVQSLQSLTASTSATTTTASAINAAAGTATTTKQDEHNAQQQQLKTESSLGYSTIDFIKTCALIKSSTHGGDFDGDHDHDQEESRKTRHSKGVRKAYSISE